ncbi:hypothetical protein BC832DRAFT_559366 [Gaertneriomyces semiglobifer]|nr:hypothetical protein BC832DRAFT_559366 [Gaertneriomyces semiglobifer]
MAAQTIMYTAEVPDAPEVSGSGKPRRHFCHVDQKLVGAPEGVSTLYDNFLRGVSISGDSPFLGTRPITNGVPGPYVWQTYNEILRRVKNLASGIALRNVKVDANVGLFSINRAEWIIAEQACFYLSAITVPLYDTLGVDAIEFIANQAELEVIVATKDKAKILLDMKDKLAFLKYIIVMDAPDDYILSKGKELNVEVVSIVDVEREGAEKPHDGTLPNTDTIATICYTSGTTGQPKGVMLSHENLLAFCGGTRELVKSQSLVDYNKDDSYISYLPLAHVFERIVIVCLTYVGAKVGFYQGDTLKLLDDVGELKPTIFASVPRLYNRIYDKVLQSINSKGGLSAYLFNRAYEAKKYWLNNGGYTTHMFWDNVVFSKVRARLGGRVRLMMTGAAPISADVIDFLRICFSCVVIEGYGQTETAGGSAVTDIRDTSSGHIGCPVPSCEIKLIDVPSMNYTTKDKPFPRGEICIRGTNVFKGYYKAPEKTAETLDSEGWCHTGDVGRWDGQGRLQIIDRVKNIFKLAQGEYIAPEKIEMVYQKHEIVAQAFVYGDSLQSTLVAVIVPDADVFANWCTNKGLGAGKSFGDLCKDGAVTKAVLKELEAYGKKEGLKGFENVKAIHLEQTQFTPENGLLTPTFKLKRHDAKLTYQTQIDLMYKEISAKSP